MHLRVEVDYERLHFAYRVDGQDWRWLPEHFDASILSDEAAAPGTPNFTGAFVGMCCQDTSGVRRHADFDYFEYRERAVCDRSAADGGAMTDSGATFYARRGSRWHRRRWLRAQNADRLVSIATRSRGPVASSAPVQWAAGRVAESS